MNTQHNCSTELQQANLAATPARIATLKLFESHEKPMDAVHLIDHLQKELGIDRVTVFRILNAFVAKGLITKLEFGEGKARYELSKEDHHHIICENCGRVEEVADDFLPNAEKQIGRQTGFLIKRHSLEFFGLCRDCQK